MLGTARNPGVFEVSAPPVRAEYSGNGGCAVKCDVCEKECANSEELQAHKEREHPVTDRDDGPEMPDRIEGGERPEPIVRPVR